MLRSTLNSPGNPWSQSRRMIERVFPEIWTRADRQTDRQTDAVITILRSAIGGGVIRNDVSLAHQIGAASL